MKHSPATAGGVFASSRQHHKPARNSRFDNGDKKLPTIPFRSRQNQYLRHAGPRQPWRCQPCSAIPVIHRLRCLYRRLPVPRKVLARGRKTRAVGLDRQEQLPVSELMQPVSGFIIFGEA